MDVIYLFAVIFVKLQHLSKIISNKKLKQTQITKFTNICKQFLIFFSSIEKITSSIENVSNDDISDPISIYKISEKPLSLAFHREFLIVGSNNGIVRGYKVSHGIIQNKSWEINIQSKLPHEEYEISEVNDLWIDYENDLLYCACGLSIFKCSLDDGSVIKSFRGHKDYIHSVDGYMHIFVTSSEDGTVKLWDDRQEKATFTLEPSKNPNLQRKSFGKWMGSASLSKEWLACGGASKCALFHLNQLSNRQPFQIFDYPKEIHVTKFIASDNLLVAGESNVMIQYSLKGDMISEIETSGPAIYSVVWQKRPQSKILSACGASNSIDVTTNFIYKDATLNFYKKEI